jgi:ABC-2 type transport system ATP-binding protein
MAPVLEVQNLVKDYPGVRALDNVSFAIEGGICFGLLGPNGAGKTTTIEIAEGILPATSGRVLYKGAQRSGSFKEEMGIQFQSTSLLAFLSVRESLDTFRRLYTHPLSLDALIELCRLEEILDRRNDKISGGQRQRLLLAMALVNDPELIFLDEPTTGLDPQARRHLWDIVGRVKTEGKTVVLTTHYMEEAEILCDDIAIVDKGKIIARGAPEELLRKSRSEVTIQVAAKALPEDAPDLFVELKRSGTVTGILESPGGFELQTTRVNACLETLLAHRVDLSQASVRSKNLEDLFIQITGRRLRD